MIVEVCNLYKSFKIGFIPKKVDILKEINFVIKKNRITGFIGSNGAGKTTVLKCMLGFIFPDKGEIKFFGDQKIGKNVKENIGFLPERPYFYDFLTGYEFLRFHGLLHQKNIRRKNIENIDYVLKRVGLSHAKNLSLRNFSKGMLQRIGIAQAILHKPKLLILDEPMSGLDPDGRFEVTQIIKDIAEEGTTIFFSSHLLNDAEKLCQDIVILKSGKSIYNGSISELLSRKKPIYKIRFYEGKHEEKIEEKIKEVDGTEQLQKEINFLISEKKIITEIFPVKMDLETAFQELSR